MSSWECPFEDRCLNGPDGKEECYRCTDQHLLKLPEDKARDQARRRAQSKATSSQMAGKDSWKELEKGVSNKLNSNPYRTFSEAHRQLRSGGIWFLPGDVADPVMLMECKERTKFTAKGEQGFTIEKGWLEKIMEESQQTKRFPGLCFRFKNDYKIYTVKDFEVETEMVYALKSLMQENQEQASKIAELEARLQKYEEGHN